VRAIGASAGFALLGITAMKRNLQYCVFYQQLILEVSK
jgi:hypothetical protein